MTKILSTSQIEQFERDGIAFPVPALRAHEVLRFRSEFAEVRQALGARATPHDLRQPQLHFQWAYDLALTPRILDAIEDLIGPNILVCRGTVFFKEPGPGFYTFHQDAYGLGMSPAHMRKFVTAWIALTDSNSENGCMQVVPGSHAAPTLPHFETLASQAHDSNSAVSRGLTADVDIDTLPKLDVVLKPGEMSLHHGNLLHGSGMNRTELTRVGVVVRYVSPDVRERRALSHPVILARGRDEYRYNQHLLDPPRGSIKEALRATAEYVASHPEGRRYTSQSALLTGESSD